MCRSARAIRRLARAAPVAALLLAGPARAGLLDTVLETLDVKAPPAAPAPDFVERSRPDLNDTGYMPTASPHKVSPLAVKTPVQIQAAKDALDAAKARQLDPGRPKPLQKGRAAKATSAPN